MKRKLLYWWHRLVGANCWRYEHRCGVWSALNPYWLCATCARDADCTGRIRYCPDDVPKRNDVVEEGRP